MTTHDLSTRMTYIRAALCDPRLTNRQQKALAAVATFMPFDTDEGWVIKTEEIAKSIYFGKEASGNAIREARRILKQLEDLGLVQRVYAGSRKNPHSDPTFYVNWDRLLEPYREALSGDGHTGQGAPSTRGKVPLSSIRTQEYPGAGSAQGPRLRLVDNG